MADFLNQVASIASTYGTDTIFILGKGPSVDEVAPDAFAGSLVIGINDAERIVPADISIFHADWVKNAVIENGLRSRLYVTSTDFHPRGAEVVKADFIPLRNDTSDLMMSRLQSSDFAIEEVLFLSALKIATYVAKQRGRPQTVYMVGFDFQSDAGYSNAITRDYVSDSEAERSSKIMLQEFYFINTLYVLKNTDLDIVHVGNRSFSQLTAAELNARFLPALPIEVTNHKVKVVAELTTNHFGDRHRLERMIRAARAAGADLIKLQKRDVATFYSPEQLASPYVSPFGTTFADYRYGLELDRDDFLFVDNLCRELGVDWFASILDRPSFEFMMEFERPLVKLPSTISRKQDYLSFVAQNYTGSVVLSTGMTDQAYEDWVLEIFTRCESLYLLQCNSAYPTPSHDCNVGVVRHYHDLARRHPRIIPGYSSHDFGWFASALAVAAGARMVEKHVKLGNTEWAHFDAVAVDLTTPVFKEYVSQIREAELVTGGEEKK